MHTDSTPERVGSKRCPNWWVVLFLRESPQAHFDLCLSVVVLAIYKINGSRPRRKEAAFPSASPLLPSKGVRRTDEGEEPLANPGAPNRRDPQSSILGFYLCLSAFICGLNESFRFSPRAGTANRPGTERSFGAYPTGARLGMVRRYTDTVALQIAIVRCA